MEYTSPVLLTDTEPSTGLTVLTGQRYQDTQLFHTYRDGQREEHGVGGEVTFPLSPFLMTSSWNFFTDSSLTSSEV
jgi:hypothetical protein